MMIHELQLVKILLAIYQFVQRVLEIVASLLDPHLLMLLYGSFGLLQLRLQRIDLVLLILLLLQNYAFLLLHKISLLVQDLFYPLVNPFLHFFGLQSLVLLIVLHVSFVVLDLFCLLGQLNSP